MEPRVEQNKQHSFSMLIEKQMVIRKLLSNKNLLDLHSLLESYLFLDFVYVRSRKQKNKLIHSMRYLSHSPTDKGNPWNQNKMRFYWLIQFETSFHISACQCTICGNYNREEVDESDEVDEVDEAEGLHPLPKIADRALCICN